MRTSLALLLALAQAVAQTPPPTSPPAAATFAGPWQEPGFFPLGIWLQSPANATRYQALGINLYVGLWDGPTEAQLQALAAVGMRTVCAQNEVGLRQGGSTIIGWLHGDEPDNAQAAGIGYGPPIPPATVLASYRAMQAKDRSRPVLLNLGQGAAWDGWHGRGVRTNHPEDYPEYCRAADFVSFDIYPVTHDRPAVAGKLEFVARGVQQLRAAAPGKPVWACLETTHVENPQVRPTPAQVRDEAWLAIAAGASGLVWFAHEFRPKFVEAGLLAYPEVGAAVAEVTKEVTALAPILNRPPRTDRVTIQVEGGSADDVAVRCHDDGKDLVVIAASLASEPRQVTFTFVGRPHGTIVSLGGGAPQPVRNGQIALPFEGYSHRSFRLRTR